MTQPERVRQAELTLQPLGRWPVLFFGMHPRAHGFDFGRQQRHAQRRRITYCKSYINRWGQLMVAERYGYKYWRFSK